jgi:XTP/dITP diphosphohydrolase
MLTLLIASRNAHKVQEIRAVLGPEYHCLSLRDFPDAPETVEDAPTFAGNAARKAQTLAAWLRDRHPATAVRFVLADDSGLEVDALDGAPGVRSARFARENSPRPGNATDAENNAKLLGLLAAVPLDRRTGRFRCVVALVPLSAPTPRSGLGLPPAAPALAGETPAQLFEGTCEGQIRFEPCGQSGFGYDPLFQPQGSDLTFAELGEAVKNGISHRARALARARAWLEEEAMHAQP